LAIIKPPAIKQIVATNEGNCKLEREKDKIPSLWKSVEITFELYGNVDKEKAKKAASLSMEKYCSVAETLRRSGTEITWNVKVINTEKVLA